MRSASTASFSVMRSSTRLVQRIARGQPLATHRFFLRQVVVGDVQAELRQLDDDRFQIVQLMQFVHFLHAQHRLGVFALDRLGDAIAGREDGLSEVKLVR